MPDLMQALVYEAPHKMNVREIAPPEIQPDEVLVQVAYSGICGSELSGFEGKNALRKPPLVMGHEFSGKILALGSQVQNDYTKFSVGDAVTANPIISCRQCPYCLSGRQQLCVQRKLHSASLPGSNAELIAVRADAVYKLPDDMPLTTAALTEPAACALHAVEFVNPTPAETGLVVGAGPIGLLTVQALLDYGMKQVYAADLNAERLQMATDSGATPVDLRENDMAGSIDIAIDAVGIEATRRACLKALRSGGKVVWVGLHEPVSPLDVNDMIRREIVSYGSFAYNQVDFGKAIDALYTGRLWLKDGWTRVEPLKHGTASFEELINGSPVSKIWLNPQI